MDIGSTVYRVIYTIIFVALPFAALEGFYGDKLSKLQLRTLEMISAALLILGASGYLLADPQLDLGEKFDSLIQNASVSLVGGTVLLVFFGYITQVLGGLGNKQDTEIKKIAQQQEEILKLLHETKNTTAETNIDNEEVIKSEVHAASRTK
jgi:hypothetical protein